MTNEQHLAHYGVKGMRWGVRKDPDRAYTKAVNKLRRIESAQQRASTSRAKIRAAGYQKRAAKLESEKV